MLFNPTDKSNSIIADIDFLLWNTSTTFNSKYSLDDRTRNVNISLDEVVPILFRADPNFMWDDTTNPDYPIAYKDLEAGRSDYLIPDSSLVIHRIRIKDRTGSYRTLTPKLRREFDDSDLNSEGDPIGYSKIDNAIMITPTPDYSAVEGLEIEFQRGANHFDTTDQNVSPGFAPQFHQFLSINAALRYAIASNMTQKIQTLSALKKDLIQAIEEHYQRRSPDERPQIRLKTRPVRSYGM